MSYSLNALYRSVGITKQSVHQMERRDELFVKRLSSLLIEVQELREVHPGCGIEKMYYTLKPDFLGRDRFIEVMMGLGYRVKRNRNYHRTTYPTNLYYPNLIKGLELNGPSQVWQSDLTYIRVKDQFYYAVFIIDVYTRIIVGYSVTDHMRATSNMAALRMALKYYDPPQIHHSDRGSQYIYKEYVALLKSKRTQISMGLIAQENAYAERINRTIKEEYITPKEPGDFETLKKLMRKSVNHYNTARLHNGLGRMTPVNYYNMVVTLPQLERPTLKVFQEADSELLFNNGQH
jgi:transposase InsO family protein